MILLSMCMASTAYAEVMDKEPSLVSSYLWGTIGTLVCFLSARFKPWLLLLAAPLPLIYFMGLIYEISDPYVGKAIINEAGMSYVVSSYILSAMIMAGIVVGLWLRKNGKT